MSVSKDGRWIIDNYSRASEPASLWLMPTDQGLKNETNAEAKVRQFGKPEETPWKTLGLRGPKFEFLEIEPGLKLPIQTYSPDSDLLDDGQDKKYPVLIHTYAGPLAPAAVDRWQGQNGLWHQWLANQGVVVVLVDVRSSAGRGPKDTWPIYGRMGEDELKDLEAIVDRLAERPWFDAKRVGIWGWSYGGFFASYVLTHSDKFRCGIAGAPVTDWRNYDAIYTERYMNLPKDNESGYKSTSVVEAAANLKQPLLIIHGGMDDNVHPHNTWQLVHEVMNHGGPIQPLFFPTSRHAVHDPMQRYWMYQRMSEFLLRELRE